MDEKQFCLRIFLYISPKASGGPLLTNWYWRYRMSKHPAPPILLLSVIALNLRRSQRVLSFRRAAVSVFEDIERTGVDRLLFFPYHLILHSGQSWKYFFENREPIRLLLPIPFHILYIHVRQSILSQSMNLENARYRSSWEAGFGLLPLVFERSVSSTTVLLN